MPKSAEDMRVLITLYLFVLQTLEFEFGAKKIMFAWRPNHLSSLSTCTQATPPHALMQLAKCKMHQCIVEENQSKSSLGTSQVQCWSVCVHNNSTTDRFWPTCSKLFLLYISLHMFLVVAIMMVIAAVMMVLVMMMSMARIYKVAIIK